MKVDENILAVGILFILLVIVFVVMIPAKQGASPSIDTVHAINLDKDKERWASLTAAATSAKIPLQRWPATYGKDIPYDEFRSLGVGHAMIRPDRNDKEHKKLVNLGVAGCFLSTRRLLTHLSTLSYPSSAGHLILDDDVVLPPDLLHPSGRWSKVRQTIPKDWDMIYLGIWSATGTDVAPGVKKLRFREDEKNVNLGTFAYIVRHGAIPKILPHLTYMIDAIDEQYTYKFNEWNVYALTPNLVSVNEEMNEDSSINKIN
jgi:GR25 family glycosyltransferase involved in LPS biosynthesis